MTVLRASHVTVRRGGRNIVDDVAFELGAGAFVALIGANGAGKSTLLSVLSGLLHADDGDISLDERPLKHYSRSALARQRAYLPQNPRCEWPISVERLIALGLTPALPAIGAMPAAYRAKIDSVIASFDLEENRLQPATTLSGGELTRAMLARALVGDPALLLADEPISDLDPRHRIDTVRRLGDLARSGKLVIASLHDLTLTARFATHVLAMKEGRLIANGPVADTLTPQLLKAVFDVEARIAGAGRDAFVDFIETR